MTQLHEDKNALAAVGRLQKAVAGHFGETAIRNATLGDFANRPDRRRRRATQEGRAVDVTEFIVTYDDGKERLVKGAELSELRWFETSAVERPANQTEGWAVIKSADTPVEKSA